MVRYGVINLKEKHMGKKELVEWGLQMFVEDKNFEQFIEWVCKDW